MPWSMPAGSTPPVHPNPAGIPGSSITRREYLGVGGWEDITTTSPNDLLDSESRITLVVIDPSFEGHVWQYGGHVVDVFNGDVKHGQHHVPHDAVGAAT